MKQNQIIDKTKIFLTVQKRPFNCMKLKESIYNFKLNIEDVKKKYGITSDEYDFPTEYIAMSFNTIDRDKAKEYFFSKDYLSKKSNLWLKSHVIFNSETDINLWKIYFKNYLENIVIGGDDIYGYEFLAKIRSLTSHYGEPNRCSLQPFSLDEGYEYLFDSKKVELKNEFKIESWSINKKDNLNFKIVAYCSLNFFDENFDPILFRVFIMSYEKLINVSGALKTLDRPLSLILSNHTNRDELEIYMKDTFKNIRGSSIEEIKLKLATFTEDIDVLPLLKKTFHRGKPYSLQIIE